MTWLIRPARPQDAEVLADYNCRMALETEGKELDSAVLAAGVAAALADPAKGRYFVAEDAGRVIGQLMLTFEWSDWRNGWIWWIQSVYVCHEARRRGVFASLFQHVVDAARGEPSVVAIRLYVERDNLAAQKTYQRCGLAPTSYLLFEGPAR